MKKTLLALLILAYACSSAQFMHREGQNIIGNDNKPVILRGLGLGGWMIQEGYMLKTDAFAGPQHKIREKIEALIGERKTEQFYQAYRDNSITKQDIDSLKAWGFNSIRLPMHYNLYTPPIEKEKKGRNTWLEEGFARTDALLAWCEQNQMYLILDMHATPGGQGNDANISDYDTSKPSLWESEANKNKLIALWRKLAERYKDSKWIGGYDLINEPNWAFTGSNKNGCDEKLNAPLRALYVDITKAIREVDQRHMIIIEGNCWGNNYNGILGEGNGLWDDNVALSFHKYWNYNNQGAISGITQLRSTYNVPIWLGESGENSNAWFRDAISLCERNNIGWAWWPMKKIDNTAGPASVTLTSGYQKLLDYWKDGGQKPSPDSAFEALMELAANYNMKKVALHPDVIDAMFRQVRSIETKPYKRHDVSAKIFASEYDMGTNGIAYEDQDIANYWVDSGKREPWNQGHAMRNDGVDIQPCKDAVSNGFEVFKIEPGEWLVFTVNASKTAHYGLQLRYSGKGSLNVIDGNGRISETLELVPTAESEYRTATLHHVGLIAGENHVRLAFNASGLRLNWMQFQNPE